MKDDDVLEKAGRVKTRSAYRIVISLCVGAMGMFSNALDELSSKVSLLMEQEKHVFHCVCCMFDSVGLSSCPSATLCKSNRTEFHET